MKPTSKMFLTMILLTGACTPLATPFPTQEIIDSTPAAIQTKILAPTLDPNEPPPSGAQQEFKTDFTRHSIPYSDILSGGPPKDGIPALDAPLFVPVSEADLWLGTSEPVILVEVNGQARAYPLQILMWHEIVNDTLNGEPLTVTFCPLCNTAIAFKRTVNGQILDFGTTGRLRFSNLIMYDRQTESWWQQATGDAIVGELLGTQLEYYPAAIVSWESFKSRYPDGDVLSRETGYNRNYGNNPYIGYDDINNTPFLYRGTPTPNQLAAVARVITVDLNGEAVAYPYDLLAETRIVNDTVGGSDIVIFWQSGVVSALDGSDITTSRDVGTAVSFSRDVEGRTLTFIQDGTLIKDKETDSTWTFYGEAVDGELQGTELSTVVSINHFWFSWAAFRPDTRIYQP